MNFEAVTARYVDVRLERKKEVLDAYHGLSCLHGKKTDFLLQEVFARLILYNYASLIARKIPVPQEKQINFSVAILVCKQFLKGKIRPAQIFEILSKYLSPIRPGRQYRRYQNPVSAVAFQYRFS